MRVIECGKECTTYYDGVKSMGLHNYTDRNRTTFFFKLTGNLLPSGLIEAYRRTQWHMGLTTEQDGLDKMECGHDLM